jgi:hypothetical protein
LDALKTRHDYQAWRDANTLPENLFIQGFVPSGDELPGWRTHRVQVVEGAGWPRMIQSVWVSGEMTSEALCSVDVFDCASRAEAHEVLVRVLGEFQSPQVEREQEASFGDVAFATPGSSAFAFARANLVLLVRSAGRATVPLADLAQVLDSDLVARPTAGNVRVTPEISRLGVLAGTVEVGSRAPLAVEAADPLGRPLWYKFFSAPGMVLREADRLVYATEVAGPQQLTAYVINANRGVASARVQFTAGGPSETR